MLPYGVQHQPGLVRTGILMFQYSESAQHSPLVLMMYSRTYDGLVTGSETLISFSLYNSWVFSFLFGEIMFDLVLHLFVS